jgi:hypothetical protein
VDVFIRQTVSKENLPGLYEHQDITSGQLVVDESRKAYTGSIENNILQWEDVSARDMTIGHVVRSLKEKTSMSFAIPIDLPPLLPL